jgi:uncharacterized membrane protein YhaH (DUF805 family)
VRTCLRNYANFNGRSGRPEFWWFYLFTVVVALISTIPLLVLTFLVIIASDNGGAVGLLTALIIIWTIVVIVVSVGLYIPLLAVGARRLHDYGQSGWWLLLLLVPFGSIALIVLWALDGTPGENQYGPRPS